LLLAAAKAAPAVVGKLASLTAVGEPMEAAVAVLVEVTLNRQALARLA
jgi:hypothetical protein